MGPHSYEQGNKRKRPGLSSGQAGFNGASLLRARKPRLAVVTPDRGKMLQWGLTLTSKETGGQSRIHLQLKELQWGLTLTSKETSPESDNRQSRKSCFNGASLLRARKLGRTRAARIAAFRLQWGLTLTSKETGRASGRRRRLHGFNGASLLRARKRGNAVHCGPYLAQASMGPHSYEQGNSLSASISHNLNSNSMRFAQLRFISIQPTSHSD